MKSPICEMFGIDFPLVAFSHCRDVVAAVSKAGGLGVYGAARDGVEQMRRELDWIDAHVDGRPYGVDIPVPENMSDRSEKTNVALRRLVPEAQHRFVDALLERHGVNPRTPVPEDEEYEMCLFRETGERFVEEALRHPVRLVVNALGTAPAFMVERCHAAGVRVGALCGAKEHALNQVKAGVDVIIAAGTEAAAHCGEISTMVLVAEVMRALEAEGIRTPVLAAGGIVTGRQMAAAMAMGAAGVWCGSVWMTTVESDVSRHGRDAILAARSRDTVRSRAWSGKPLRQLRSAWNQAWDGPESPGIQPMPLQTVIAERALQQVNKSIEGGNEKARPLITEAVGQGVGMMDSEKTVRAVVQEFREDFAEAVERLTSLV